MTEAFFESNKTSMLETLLQESGLDPTDDGYDLAKQGIRILVSLILTPRFAGETIDRVFVDKLIAEIDDKLSRQLDEILHHKEFQKLESAWRGLKFVIDRVDFRENIKVEVLNLSKEDLQTDFEDAPEITKCSFYRTVYTECYGTFGGKPFAAIFSNYDIGPSPQDIAFLSNCASIAAMAHAPFFAAASPEFFGEKDFLKLPTLRDLRSIFESPKYTKWMAFRESEDSRYVGLLLPRFLLRLPYGEQTVAVRSFNYNEDVVGNFHAYLWGNATHALATRLADSFAKYRWCPNIIGPQAGGTVENMLLHNYSAMGNLQQRLPTEVLISERREFELADEGFIALCFRKDADNACFFSANSCQKPKYFGTSKEGKEAELNYRLGTQLPYIFIISRIAHYLKVLQREQIGSWKERTDLEVELNNWVSQYVADMEGASATIRGQRPLRKAKVMVSDVPGIAGWYKIDMKLQPHFKYMGASFELSLVGKLEKE